MNDTPNDGSVILVVDDSPFARRAATICLGVAGLRDAEFLQAEHGREAIAVLKSRRVDLVVSDLNMPVMDGYELVRRIRASPRFHAIPIIVVSSVGDPATKERLEKAGVDVVVSKPLSGPKAMEAVGSVAERIGA